MTATLGIVDYGSGNFGSVWNAGLQLRIPMVAIRKPDDAAHCSHIILPGVGAFAAAMEQLRASKLDQLLLDQVQAGERHVLGICVGMQILATWGREFGSHAGLGLIAGSVERIDVGCDELPLPHMGWNTVDTQKNSPLFEGMRSEPTFYFVHSYHLIPEDSAVVAATANYGDTIVAAISSGTLHGVQFHPEKSQEHGLALLQNFTRLEV